MKPDLLIRLHAAAGLTSVLPCPAEHYMSVTKLLLLQDGICAADGFCLHNDSAVSAESLR